MDNYILNILTYLEVLDQLSYLLSGMLFICCTQDFFSVYVT